MEENSNLIHRTAIIDDNSIIIGATLLGRGHQSNGKPCQDYHLVMDLGDGWHLYLVSDGAGSAKASDRGARYNCELMSRSLQRLIKKKDWKANPQPPTELEWHVEFDNLCRGIKNLVTDKVESLDEPVEKRDFNATILVLLTTPQCMLCGHIGDGRMGYQDIRGEWHSLMTPHKGEEANQTVFLMNNWDKPRIPAPSMSGVYVPETRVVIDVPAAVVLLSDGCENFAWQCVMPNEETGVYYDKNQPFEGFLNPLIDNIKESPQEEMMDCFASFIDSANPACLDESDDRTLLLGIYGLQKQIDNNTAEESEDIEVHD